MARRDGERWSSCFNGDSNGGSCHVGSTSISSSKKSPRGAEDIPFGVDFGDGLGLESPRCLRGRGRGAKGGSGEPPDEWLDSRVGCLERVRRGDEPDAGPSGDAYLWSPPGSQNHPGQCGADHQGDSGDGAGGPLLQYERRRRGEAPRGVGPDGKGPEGAGGRGEGQ